MNFTFYPTKCNRNGLPVTFVPHSVKMGLEFLIRLRFGPEIQCQKLLTPGREMFRDV